MRKIIRKIGTSAGFIFSKTEMEAFKLVIGDVISMPDDMIKKVEEIPKNTPVKIKEEIQV